MIAGILPGLRELRTPLAAGYILVTALYVAFFDSIDHLFMSEDVYSSIADKLVTLGPAAVLAAITFVAYLGGSIWTDAIVWMIFTWPTSRRPLLAKRISQLRHPSRAAVSPPSGLRYWALTKALGFALASSDGNVRQRQMHESTLRSVLIVQFANRFRSEADLRAVYERRELFMKNVLPDPIGELSVDNIARVVDIEQYVNELRSELQTLPVQLLGRDQEIWNSWDRQRSEAEFRVVISIALAVLALALAVKVTWVWLALLSVNAVLFILGLRKAREANAALYELVGSGRVRPRLTEAIETLRSNDPIYWTPAPTKPSIRSRESSTGQVGA